MDSSKVPPSGGGSVPFLSGEKQTKAPNESDAASWWKVKDTPKGIFHEKFKKIDSSNRMNLADSSGIKTPELVHIRHSPVDTYGEPDNASVATGISDENSFWLAKLRDIGGTAATHDDLTQISETQKFKQLVKNIDFERFKTLEQEKIEEEKIEREKIEQENIEREILNLKNYLFD